MPPKHLSGFQKRKNRQRIEEFRKSQTGDMFRYLLKQPQGPNIDEANADANPDEANANADEANIEKDDGANIEEDGVGTNVEEDDVEVNQIDIFDPRNWGGLNLNMINVLVEKGLKRDLTIDKGPKDKLGRRFHATLYTRILSKGENCERIASVFERA
ncbi:uncharacterized protein LOC143616873 [Bidens hawaiensis]|uniref:uncharacterized protein LOC143616873 n=1 Tax=Bidens hawaiensis TaxID=980011 RepID=UPI00404A17B9